MEQWERRRRNYNKRMGFLSFIRQDIWKTETINIMAKLIYKTIKIMVRLLTSFSLSYIIPIGDLYQSSAK